MRALLFSLVVLAGSHYGQAQGIIPYNPDVTHNTSPTPANAGTRERFEEERQREANQQEPREPESAVSPHLLPYWTRGLLRPYAGPPSRPWLKYDVLNHRLLTRSATGEVAAVNTDALSDFTVGDSLFNNQRTYRRYLSARMASAGLRTVFFEVRYDAGRAALLCRQVADDRAAASQPTANHLRGRRAGTLAYYLLNTTNTLTPVALTLESILAAIEPTHRATVAAYASDHGLNLNREADMVKLLAHYDAL